MTTDPSPTDQSPTAPSGIEHTALGEVRAAVLDAARLVRAVASGRQRNRTVDYRRVELRYVQVKAGIRLQVTSYDDTQAHTRNVEPGEPAEGLVEALLSAGHANWHVECVDRIIQLRVTKKGRPLLHVAALPPAAAGRSADQQPDRRPVRQPDRRHDRAKRRRLDEHDPLFALLGITTAEGVVKPSRTAKFRQVQDLLAAVDPLIDDAVHQGPGDALSADRPLRIVDLGCGNAYLTFAAYRYLSAVRDIPVHVTGIDAKEQALRHNTDIAEQLGVAGDVRFERGTIAGAALNDAPDMVLALHACDTATDEALARAVGWEAPVVVAAPCCHHDIARQLSAETTPTAYRLVTRHAILRERMADVLTDAFRAALLRLAGYRVDVIEFVDSTHTPRNALIRAVWTGAPAPPEALDAYRQLTAQWGVTPALERMLEDRLPLLRGRLGG